ncbi:MAG: hypothetical protein IJW51_01710 [Clostridia bacterium]|nr:hypothetical protein [Clostridia bacterium]
MEKTSKKDMLLLAVLCGLLAFGGLSLLLFPAPRFSAQENRFLAEKPDFSWQELQNGSYTAAWERYTAERIRGRGLLRSLHAATELTLGKCEAGNVIFCKDGSLAKRLDSGERILQKNLKILTGLESSCRAQALPLTVAVAPRRIDARAAALPRLYRSDGNAAAYRRLTDTCAGVVTFPALTADGDWFHTDHHWTAAGAYRAYCALAPALGYSPYGAENFSVTAVSAHFSGTSDAAAGIAGITPDRIELWRYEGDETFHVKKDGSPANFKGLYDLEKLRTRDGYAVFLGGNDGVLEITTGENDDRPTLLLIRDSFAGALLPFLARHYRIIAIDPRYAPRGIVEAYLPAASRVLFLCGMQTLSDTSLQI